MKSFTPQATQNWTLWIVFMSIIFHIVNDRKYFNLRQFFFIFSVHNQNETEFLVEEKEAFHNSLIAHIRSKTGKCSI